MNTFNERLSYLTEIDKKVYEVISSAKVIDIVNSKYIQDKTKLSAKVINNILTMLISKKFIDLVKNEYELHAN